MEMKAGDKLGPYQILATPNANHAPELSLTFLLNFADELKRKAPAGKK
jgi:hypothetical protein